MPAKMSYEDWMKKVDEACWAKAGCSIHDLPDFPSADYYEDGMSPKAAAAKAIKAAKSEY